MAADLCVCFFFFFLLFSYAKYRYDPISSVLSRYSLYHPVVKLYRVFKGEGFRLETYINQPFNPLFNHRHAGHKPLGQLMRHL